MLRPQYLHGKSQEGGVRTSKTSQPKYDVEELNGSREAGGILRLNNDIQKIKEFASSSVTASNKKHQGDKIATDQVLMASNQNI